MDYDERNNFLDILYIYLFSLIGPSDLITTGIVIVFRLYILLFSTPGSEPT